MARPAAPRLALVGASTALGAEVKARLESSGQKFREVVLAEIDAVDSEGARLLGEFGGEAMLVTKASEMDFAAFDLAVLLGTAGHMEPLLERASQAQVCVDASGASRRRQGVAWVQTGIAEPVAGPGETLAAPQPVAWTLAHLLHPLQDRGLLRAASATALLPASSRGTRAVEELHQQAAAVLNFQDAPQEHLHGRLAFNVLPWEDACSDQPLSGELAWEVGRLLRCQAPPCALQLLLLSSFVGHAYSVRVDLEEECSADEMRALLAGGAVRITDSPPSLLDAVDGTGVLAFVAPSGKGRSHWLWAVSDSMGAGAAVNIVQQLERLARTVPVLRSVD